MNKFCEKVNKLLPYIGFIVVCFFFGTSYAISTLGYKVYDNVLFISMRMIFAFIALLIAFIIYLSFSKKYRAFIKESFRSGDTCWWKAMILGLLQYGFPHSMIALGQRSVSSTIVTIVQPLVPGAALLFASIFLPDERFTWPKLIPHVIAIIGCSLTCIPPFLQTDTKGQTTNWYDMLMVFIAVFSFGFGSVFYKMFLVRSDFLAVCVLQLLGSSIYALVFSIIRRGWKENFDAWFHPKKEIFWPFLIGVGYTATSACICVWICRKLGAVKSQLVNFGQIAIGVITGVVFMHDFRGYEPWMQAVSYVGVILLIISMVIGFYVDHTKEVIVNNNVGIDPLISDTQDSKDNSPKVNT